MDSQVLNLQAVSRTRNTQNPRRISTSAAHEPTNCRMFDAMSPAQTSAQGSNHGNTQGTQAERSIRYVGNDANSPLLHNTNRIVAPRAGNRGYQYQTAMLRRRGGTHHMDVRRKKEQKNCHLPRSQLLTVSTSLPVQLSQKVFESFREPDFLAQDADLEVFATDGTLATGAAGAVAGNPITLALHLIVVELSSCSHTGAVLPIVSMTFSLQAACDRRDGGFGCRELRFKPIERVVTAP